MPPYLLGHSLALACVQPAANIFAYSFKLHIYVIHSATGFNLQPGFYSILSLARGLCVKIAIQAFGYFTLFSTAPQGISKSMRAPECLYYYFKKLTNKYKSRFESFLIFINPSLIYFYK